MSKFIGTVILICFVLLSGWLLGCDTRPEHVGATDSEGKAVMEDADQPRKAIPRKRGRPFMYA